ncbi:MAG: putative sulfate exporter family transporter [bacterium]|nr:putative sulfate exporter family transporter [bacterium]
MTFIEKEIKGILLSVFLGLAGFFLANYTPSWLNSILLSLLLGMLAGNLLKIPTSFQTGISFIGSKLLEISILFLAFSINYANIAALGIGSFSIIGIMVLMLLLVSFYLATKINCPGATGWLVGFGTTICGSAAIAALAPSIKKNEDDVAISMAVVNLFGSLGMIVLPFVLLRLNLSTQQMGIMLGGTLHSVGNVAGAGYSMSKDVGEAAITIKLARVALLSPALIFFNYLVNKDQVKHWKEHFKLPWYLWGFIVITLLSSVVNFPKELVQTMELGGKILLSMVMAAIGLKVSFQKLLQSGKKGLGFGLIIFIFQIILVAVLIWVIN